MISLTSCSVFKPLKWDYVQIIKTETSASWHEMPFCMQAAHLSGASAQHSCLTLSWACSINHGDRPFPGLSFVPIGGDAAVDLQLKDSLWTCLHPDSQWACQHFLGQGLVLSPAFQICFWKEKWFVCFFFLMCWWKTNLLQTVIWLKKVSFI